MRRSLGRDDGLSEELDFDERPLCYIAGPYSHPDPVENTHEAIRIAEEIQETGQATAYVPHMSLLWHLIRPHSVDWWYAFDLAFLARCDCLLRIPGESVGADNEIAYAKERHIPVFYTIESLMEWIANGN